MDRRTGIPITLSAVAMAIGNRAGLEVVGVALPGHFIVKAVRGGKEVFFDPFHGGRVLSPEECELLVRQVTGMEFEANAETLQACDLGPMIFRMLSNLKAVYLSDGDFARAVRIIERLLQLSPDDPLQLRDLGATLLQDGQPGRAIDPLNAYLAARPDASDAEAVRKLLSQSEKAVARWN
jgi:regulator of sirC expression with transglutaminase-like and TPR domain